MSCILRMCIASLAFVSFLGTGLAQLGEGAAGVATKITEARQKNAALMQHYTWQSRTELIKGGSVKDVRLDQVTFGPGGQLQRTPLNNSGASMPRGFLRRAVAENQKKEMEDYLTGLRALLDQYTLPTAGKVLDFINSATIQPAAGGTRQLTGSNVVMPGDQLTMTVDQATHQFRNITVVTTYKGDRVNLTASYKTEPDGLNHVQFGEVEVPTKELNIQVHNFDYEKNN